MRLSARSPRNWAYWKNIPKVNPSRSGLKTGFDDFGVPEAGLCTWEKFKEKKYYVVPTDPDWEKIPAGMIEFYKDPEKYPLSTPCGKLEFYSERLAKALPG